MEGRAPMAAQAHREHQDRMEIISTNSVSTVPKEHQECPDLREFKAPQELLGPRESLDPMEKDGKGRSESKGHQASRDIQETTAPLEFLGRYAMCRGLLVLLVLLGRLAREDHQDHLGIPVPRFLDQ